VAVLEELTPQECRELIARRSVGRLALSTPAGLRIYPVNFALHGDEVVFRTGPYGDIADNAVDAQVAFSVDDLDEELRTGWHVLAVGTCRRVEDPAQVQAIRADQDPEPWAGGRRNLYFRLAWDDLTGRRDIAD
jgi:uncharacterized protein